MTPADGKGEPGPARGDPDPVTRVEREEFARGHIGPGEEPVEPRPAATVVVARPTPAGGFETLLLRRPESARFAAGAYVFPGGVLDEADGDPELAGRLPGHVTPEERPALVAALRELFEETGFLPADHPVDPERAGALRRALLEHRSDFRAAARRLGAEFGRLRVVTLSRWVTPARLQRRYDTRFFLAAFDGGVPDLTPEHTAHLWIRPRAAIRRFRSGELPMLFPTWKTLETLAGFGTLEEALERLRDRPVETIRPRLLVEGDRVSPLMPGEPGYDDAAPGAE